MLSRPTINGRLTADPELRSTRNGKRATTLRVAVCDHLLGHQPRYIDIAQWEDAAERAALHLVRGQEITAEGLLDARPYATDGLAGRRGVVAEVIPFLDERGHSVEALILAAATL